MTFDKIYNAIVTHFILKVCYFVVSFKQNLGQQTDTVILDFSKAFDTVPHQWLLMKLRNNGIRDEMNAWIDSWLKNWCQSVVIDGEKSEEAQVRSGVPQFPQGTVLGLLISLLYINDIGNDLTSKIRLFADDCHLFES